MKRFVLTVVLTLSSLARASNKDFIFVYTQESRGQTKRFEFKARDMSYGQALRLAAIACLDHFGGRNLAALTEDQKLDLVDLCANPKTK
jgi:hypothetical protein